MPLPEGSGVAVSVDYFGPLPVTPRGNTYILLSTDRFSCRADMFPVTVAEFTAEGTANIQVNQYVPLSGCPSAILSDNGLQFWSKLSQAVYQLLGVHKLATSSYHLNCNGGVERVQRHYGPNAGYSRQRATRRLGLASAPRRTRLQQFRQRSEESGAQRGPHGQTPTAPPDSFRPRWCRGTPRVWPVITWPITTWTPTGKSAQTALSAHTTPLPFLVLTATAQKLRPRRRAACSTKLRYGWLGMGIQFCLYHPPGCEGEHRRQVTQSQTCA